MERYKMALKSKEPAKPVNGLVFRTRGPKDKKKVLIYGNDGTGKSTFAEQYCEKHGLTAICIDIDDTNFTDIPIVEVDTRNDRLTYNNMMKTIDLIIEDGRFDTIIIDGVTSLLEMLVSKGKGLSKYSDRAQRFTDILRKIQTSGLHTIWIGQADLEVVYNEEHQSNKQVIKLNSIVNEKYHCYISKTGKFEVETKKYRAIEKK